MGVKLSEIVKGVRILKVPFGTETLTVGYKLGEMTGEKIGALNIFDNLQEFIRRYVVEWDLVGGNGKPVPITKAQLAKVPVPLLRRIALSIFEDDGLGEVVSSSNGASRRTGQ